MNEEPLSPAEVADMDQLRASSMDQLRASSLEIAKLAYSILKKQAAARGIPLEEFIRSQVLDPSAPEMVRTIWNDGEMSIPEAIAYMESL